MNKHALAAASFITLVVFSAQQLYSAPAAEEAFVTRVIDGDTFEIETGAEVRVLGINTPERGQPLYENATSLLKSLIETKNITMQKDAADRDKYGRLLRHVFVGGLFVEAEMLKKGLANIYIIPPNEKHSAQLKKSEQYAKENRIGLWEADTEYRNCFLISEFRWDAPGNDMENLNGEYVSFTNGCNATADMEGWTVKDSGTKRYDFDKFALLPGKSVRLYSGCGADTKEEVFWCSKKAVWNNDGDTLYLRDAEGLLVLSRQYEGAE